MLFQELLTETYKSKAQARLFRACSHGADYDACGGTSQKKWKSMEHEFSDSTPDEGRLPERKKKENHAKNCQCNMCTNMSVNAIKAPTLAHLLKATSKKKTAKNAAFNDEFEEHEGGEHESGEDETEDISLCDQALAIIDEITGTGKGHRDLRKSDFKSKFAELRNLISQLRDHEKAEQDGEEHEEDDEIDDSGSDPFDM